MAGVGARADATRRRVIWEATAVVLLLTIYLALALSAVRRKSTTFDEISHLAIGYGRWQTGDYQFHPQNGLPQAWASLALLGGSWNFPAFDDPTWSKATSFQVGKQFFYDSGNDADDILFRARAMTLVFGVALGLLIFAWSRQLFGWPGGLVSLALFAICPSMLAHGPLATTDMAAVLFFTASLWALWQVLHRIALVNVLAGGLAMAGLFLCKMSAVIFVPAGLLMAVVRVAVGRTLKLSWRGREILVHGRLPQAVLFVGLALVQGAIVWSAIWAFFGFRYQAVREDRPNGGAEYVLGWPEYLAKPGFAMRAVGYARDHRLLPEPYLFALATTLAFSEARVSFLNGEHKLKGKVQFFPYCLLVKTSPPLFAVLGLAAVAGVMRRRSDGWSFASVYPLTPLAIFFIVYWGFALASHLNIGHRHLLPTYPVMYILAGGAACWLKPDASQKDSSVSRQVNWGWSAALGFCLLAAACEGVRTWPNYLAYFNVFAGGPSEGYRHLVDSSLDWGQDLKELAYWLRSNGLNNGQSPVYLSYFGMGDRKYYGIHANLLSCFPPFEAEARTVVLGGGTYCISATMLQGVYAHFYLYKSRWREEQERAYQQVIANRQQLDRIRDDAAAVQGLLHNCGVSSIAEFLHLYEESIFARFCAALRLRQPDSQVGYSILIYRLTDGDIHRALLGPPPYDDGRK